MGGKRERIRIPGTWVRRLAEKHGVSMQTVRMALKYVFNGERARAIRRDARAMLLAEAEKIKD